MSLTHAITATVALLVLAAPANAQKTADQCRETLERTAEKLQSEQGITAKFTMTTQGGNGKQVSTKGTIDLKGRKLRLTTAEARVWFDGKNLWTMNDGDTEATLSTPTDEERKALSPYSCLALPSEDYETSIKPHTLSNGHAGYEIHASAKKKDTDMREATLVIDAQYNLVSVSLRHTSGERTRITINSISRATTLSDATFTFPTAQYPDVEIIDLRD